MLHTNYRESCVVIYMLKNHGAVEFKDVLESLDPKILFVTQPWLVTFGFNLATKIPNSGNTQYFI